MISAKEKFTNWSIFIALAIIWGSSFILMKEGLKTLTGPQVASIRILSAGLVLAPIAIRKIRFVDMRKMGWIITSGLLGNLLPAYLYCAAETKIDSSLTGFINAFTPIFTLLSGVLFFNKQFPKNKMPGIIIGFAGMIILFLGKNMTDAGQLGYTALVIVATIIYAINANMVSRYLKDAGALTITSVGITFMAIPAGIVLALSGFFQQPPLQEGRLVSITASTVLGIMGTSVATILFYMLLKRAGALFASMVTYGIPFVALFWGLMAAENISLLQVAGLLVLLAGVWLASK